MKTLSNFFQQEFTGVYRPVYDKKERGGRTLSGGPVHTWGWDFGS